MCATRLHEVRSCAGLPTGEGQKQGFQLSFNRFQRVAFQGLQVTSDGGLIMVWELDVRLGFGDLMTRRLFGAMVGRITALLAPAA
jgi:hypothetical protein